MARAGAEAVRDTEEALTIAAASGWTSVAAKRAGLAASVAADVRYRGLGCFLNDYDGYGLCIRHY